MCHSSPFDLASVSTSDELDLISKPTFAVASPTQPAKIGQQMKAFSACRLQGTYKHGDDHAGRHVYRESEEADEQINCSKVFFQSGPT